MAEDTTPKCTLAGLCMSCGMVKGWASAKCDRCGVKTTGGDESIDHLFTENYLHLESLTLLGRVFEELRQAGVSVPAANWSLLYFMDRELPSLLSQRLKRRQRKEIESLISEISLPKVELRQTPFIMPADWDDHDAWDSYYSAWDPDRPIIASLGQWWQMGSFQRWTDKLRSDNRQTLWFPGCGVDTLPWAYALAGFDVVATDASQVAIEIQNSKHRRIDFVREQLQGHKIPHTEKLDHADSLALQFAVHDFREPFEKASFDCIIDIQAFYGLEPSSMRRAARTFCEALRPGGLAYLSMLNVKVLRANDMEKLLADVGLYIPFQQAEHDYRIGLNKLGASTRVFGTYGIDIKNPDQKGVCRELLRRWKNRRLQKVKREYKAATESEQSEVDRRSSDGVTKIATPLYNTG
jgi:hypothetical protein